jgi:hypothetical protein
VLVLVLVLAALLRKAPVVEPLPIAKAQDLQILASNLPKS